MPLLDITNPKISRFLTESYEKERYVRVRWANLHYEKFCKAAAFTKELKNYTKADIDENVMLAGMAMITRDHKVTARNRHTAPVRDHLLLKSDRVREVKPTMLPIPKATEGFLQEGSKGYMKTRSKLDPGEKYYFMESTNWIYGWKLNDSELKRNTPTYGKVSHVMNSMKSRVGPQPDPKHYKSADANPTFCSSFE